jgi:hypothetical protein
MNQITGSDDQSDSSGSRTASADPQLTTTQRLMLESEVIEAVERLLTTRLQVRCG